MKHLGGHGIGLRSKHYPQALEQGLGVPWVEAITENFLRRGGYPRAVLERVCADSKLILHGVSMSIGGLDPIDEEYLDGITELIDRFQPAIVSDHLCFSSFATRRGHDLWPIPYTEESLRHVVARVNRVQDRLGMRLVLENPSRYLAFAHDTLTEWQFLNELACESGCGVLLDVNNVHVSAHNTGFDPVEYLAGIAAEHVAQIHVAGHSNHGTYLLDDHGSRVAEPVWQLLARVYPRCSEVPVIVEWDGDVPPLAEVVAEAHKAAARVKSVRCAA